MNPYQTFTQPWRSAFAVWTVMAQAQTELALRLMGMSSPRGLARRPRPDPVTPQTVAEASVALEASVERQAPAVEAPIEPASAPPAEVLPLRLVTEASMSAIAAATATETGALPESASEPEALAALDLAVVEEPAAAVLSEAAPPSEPVDLVQAAVLPLLTGAEEETPAAEEASFAAAIPAPAARTPSQRPASGARRAKAKRS